MPKDQKVVVEGVQMIKRHTRPNPQRNIKGGIVEKEAPIHISNVAIVCKNCKKHTRIGKQGSGGWPSRPGLQEMRKHHRVESESASASGRQGDGEAR